MRSVEEPDGLSTLSERDAKRVKEANDSYSATAKLIQVLVPLGVSVSIENPESSHFWRTSFMRTILTGFIGHRCLFQHCMHGGDRNKKTLWWSHNPRDPSKDIFASLALMCDNSHSHKPWTPYQQDEKRIFPTHSEAAYPVLLCSRVATILAKEAHARGLQLADCLTDQIDIDDHVGKRQLFTTQPRSTRLAPFISEFGSIDLVFIPIGRFDDDFILKQFEKGAKILGRHLRMGFNRDAFNAGSSNHIFGEIREGDRFEMIEVGTVRNPQEFMKEAAALGHPRHILLRTSEGLKEAISFWDKPSGELTAVRAAFMKRWLRRALELKRDESELRAAMPSHLRKLMTKKRLLLWKEILNDLDYPDAKIVDEAIAGFSLTGWIPEAGVFPSYVRQPTLTEKQLKGMAQGYNRAVVEAVKSDQPSELDEQALEETEKEAAKGWLRRSKEVDLVRHHVARRFAIQQKVKLRLIDDYTICGVNCTVGLPERLRVESVEDLTAALMVGLGEPTRSTQRNLHGRTYDLKSAYKQFGVNAECAETMKICLKHPDGQPCFYDVLALPFGATASVGAFLRLSASVAYIGVKALKFCWTVFFDDYSIVCPGNSCNEVNFSWKDSSVC